jgi:hypothetical protein
LKRVSEIYLRQWTVINTIYIYITSELAIEAINCISIEFIDSMTVNVARIILIYCSMPCRQNATYVILLGMRSTEKDASPSLRLMVERTRLMPRTSAC